MAAGGPGAMMVCAPMVSPSELFELLQTSVRLEPGCTPCAGEGGEGGEGGHGALASGTESGSSTGSGLITTAQ